MQYQLSSATIEQQQTQRIGWMASFLERLVRGERDALFSMRIILGCITTIAIGIPFHLTLTYSDTHAAVLWTLPPTFLMVLGIVLIVLVDTPSESDQMLVNGTIVSEYTTKIQMEKIHQRIRIRDRDLLLRSMLFFLVVLINFSLTLHLWFDLGSKSRYELLFKPSSSSLHLSILENSTNDDSVWNTKQQLAELTDKIKMEELLAAERRRIGFYCILQTGLFSIVAVSVRWTLSPPVRIDLNLMPKFINPINGIVNS